MFYYTAIMFFNVIINAIGDPAGRRGRARVLPVPSSRYAKEILS
jgi:hypothetical protein